MLCLPLSAIAEDRPTYKNGKELLVAINREMKEMGLTEFTYDSLTVWLALRARDASHNGDIDLRTAEFLKALKAKKNFKVPVGIGGELGSTDIPLTSDYRSSDRLALPSYRLLEVQIFHIPWGKKDAQGIACKVTWNTIEVASALENGKKSR
jgi:hypothetical protein